MTDDLVKQAREFAALIMDGVFLSGSSTHDLLVGMSDRIEQLEAALRKVVVWDGAIEIAAPELGGLLIALHDARTALAGEKKDD